MDVGIQLSLRLQQRAGRREPPAPLPQHHLRRTQATGTMQCQPDANSYIVPASYVLV